MCSCLKKKMPWLTPNNMTMLPEVGTTYKNKAIRCNSLWENLYLNSQNLLHIAYIHPTIPGKRLLHIYEICKVVNLKSQLCAVHSYWLLACLTLVQVTQQKS
jgi:hypothetical protein